MVMIVALQRFLAANTLLNAKLLADGVGVDAQNMDPVSGDFRGSRNPLAVHTLVGYGATQQHALYRMGRETASDTQYWLAFVTDVDFARSMLASDPLERTYGTGGSFALPSFTDNTFLSAPPYPTSGYSMGVPAPVAGMTAAVGTAGTGANQTRVYVATFTRAAPNSDESAPSPAVELICPAGSTVVLAALPAAPAGGHSIALRRIYVATGGDFRLVAEIASTAITYTDTGTLGAVLQTGGSKQKPAWTTPPNNMIGLCELWAGMHGGFDGKSYMVCVPYFPHAWPLEFRRQVPDRIVGTAKWGQNWLLCTTGQPRVVMGSSPLAMVDSPIYFEQACVSKRSVKGVGHGVVWASNSGLCYHGQKGTYVLTELVISRASWRAMIPSTIIAASWGPWYFGFYNDGTRKMFAINVDQPDGVIWFGAEAYAVYDDPVSDALYLLISGNVIQKWDYGVGALAAATFKSKVFRHPQATNPGAARIISSAYPVTFSLWADGVLKVNAQSVASDEPFRLPSGYVAEEFQAQISGTGPLEGVYVAEEMGDLP